MSTSEERRRWLANVAHHVPLGALALCCAASRAGFARAAEPAVTDPHAAHRRLAGHTGHAPAATSAISAESVPVVVPPVSLRDEHGRSVRLVEALGGPLPTYLNFVYTSCTTVCPPMTAAFAALQQLAARRSKPIRLISVSIDPLTDTPARLAAYARQHGAQPGWQFLTGTADVSVTAQKAFGVYRGDKMNHPVAAFHRAGATPNWTRVDGFVAPATLLQLSA